MRGLPSILSLFRNKFKKFNNTGEGMLNIAVDLKRNGSVVKSQ